MVSLVEKVDKKYTYNDYLNWPDDMRCEIIDGKVYDMSPAPTTKHQKIGVKLKRAIFKQDNKLKNCELYDAPTDVVFDEYNVVQPDILIVCDKGKITQNNIHGAPDLIIEIVSKATAYKDTKVKKDLYERYGVKEYIIIFPDLEFVERYVMVDEKYSFPERFNWDEALKLKTFDIEIPLWEIFEKEKPDAVGE